MTSALMFRMSSSRARVFRTASDRSRTAQTKKPGDQFKPPADTPVLANTVSTRVAQFFSRSKSWAVPSRANIERVWGAPKPWDAFTHEHDMQDKYAYLARRAWSLPALLSLGAPLAMPMVVCALIEIELWRRRARNALEDVRADQEDTLEMIERSRAELSVLLFRAPFAVLWITLHFWRYGRGVAPVQACILVFMFMDHGKYVLAIIVCVANLVVLSYYEQYARVPSDLVALVFLLPGALMGIDEDPATLALVCLDVLSVYVLSY